MSSIPVALQLYTVRDDCARDFVGTLRQVAKIGYKAIEIGSIYGLKAAELAKVLGDLGLKVCGSHVGIDVLEGDLRPAIDDALALNNPFIVCPWLPEQYREGADAWRRLASVLTKAAETCIDSGIGLAYHNHSFEFTKLDGQYALDILYAAVDPRLVKAEIDVYWVKHGGEDPVKYLRKYSGRVPLLHIKDMEAGPEQGFAEVGEGILDMKAIIAEAEHGGAEWLIVEQDTCKRPPLDSARLSLENLRKMGNA